MAYILSKYKVIGTSRQVGDNQPLEAFSLVVICETPRQAYLTIKSDLHGHNRKDVTVLEMTIGNQNTRIEPEEYFTKRIYIVTKPKTEPPLYQAFELHDDDRTGHFTHRASYNIKDLVEELEKEIKPKPEITFDNVARLAFYKSI